MTTIPSAAESVARGARPLVVCGHPNHELAVLGHVQRWRPDLVFLTDGGGAERVAQTRACLARLGLESRARFLGHAEERFYAALLAGDAGFFRGVAEEVRAVATSLDPDLVLCDALELYNPLHDITLPLVRAALDGRARPLYELPLVHQVPSADERYSIQRFPRSRRRQDVEVLDLTPDEVAFKTWARDRVYTSLHASMGALLTEVEPDRVAREEIARAADPLAPPPADVVLRYEWRGRLLHRRQLVEEPILYREHFLPIASALLGEAAPVP